jgi:hypothetical protein
MARIAVMTASTLLLALPALAGEKKIPVDDIDNDRRVGSMIRKVTKTKEQP